MLSATFDAHTVSLPHPLHDLMLLVRRWLAHPHKLRPDEHNKPFEWFYIDNGPCGYMQCLVGYRLQDMGYNPVPFAVQSWPGTLLGHVGLTVNLPQHGDARYLVDPSFFQFAPDRLAGMTCENSPVTHLQMTPEGASMAEELRVNGASLLTPARTRAYVSAFFPGNNKGKIPEDAASALQTPPYSEFNWWYPRIQIDESLRRMGEPPLGHTNGSRTLRPQAPSMAPCRP